MQKLLSIVLAGADSPVFETYGEKSPAAAASLLPGGADCDESGVEIAATITNHRGCSAETDGHPSGDSDLHRTVPQNDVRAMPLERQPSL